MDSPGEVLLSSERQTLTQPRGAEDSARAALTWWLVHLATGCHLTKRQLWIYKWHSDPFDPSPNAFCPSGQA